MTDSKTIFLSPPYLNGNELALIQSGLESGYITTSGPQVQEFENQLAILTNRKFAVALNSGTSALHLALKSINIQKNEVVLCSTFTFAASAFPIIYEGALPYFIDSESYSWNIDLELIKTAVLDCKNKNLKIKALIATDLFGMPCNWTALKTICQENNIILIQDSAEALGSIYNSVPIGKQGDISIFSFNGNKIITTSGGGAFLTDYEEFASHCKYFANQAKENTSFYEHHNIGYNYRLSNILASIGISQLENLNWRVQKKQQIFKKYQEYFSHKEFEYQQEPNKTKSNRWLSCVVFKSEEIKNKVISVLQHNNIESRHLWKPMHLQPVFNNSLQSINGVSANLFQRGLCLPSGLQLQEKDIEKIANILLNI